MDVEQRLNRLEWQNRRLKNLMFTIILAGISLLVMGQAAPPKVHDVLNAKDFRVIGNDGKLKIRLWSDNTSGIIVVSGTSGRPEVTIGATKLGGTIDVKNSSGRGRNMLAISTNDAGDGSLILFDRNGVKSMSISIDRDGEGRLVKYNRIGKPIRAWPSYK